MFWAPRRMFESRIALETSDNAVEGGHTTMSTSLMLANSIFKPRTRSKASATVLFIFQLPAMISLRSLFITWRGLLFAQHRNSRQNLTFQEFETGSPASAHEADLVPQLGFVQG